jgi:hypothetical protein
LENVEIAILEHVRRYRIGITRSCWSALRSRFPALTEQQTKGSLKELWLQKGLLRRESLLGTRQCYQLTRRYWQQHGDVGEIGRQRLSERDLAVALAMLKLCFSDGDGQRRKLMNEDFATCFPDIQVDSQNRENYYLHEGRIGYLRVDLGGRGRWDRIAAYCARDLARHERQPAFAPLMRDGYFEMTIVTCMPQKARRLRQLLARQPLHEVVAVDVVAFPELLNLVSPPPIRPAFIPRSGF